MEKIVGVQFQKNGKLYYFDSNNIDAGVGDYVIVDTVRGIDLGEVMMGSREIDTENWNAPLRKLIRIATDRDIQHSIDNRQKERDAFVICQNKIAEHKLEMKLVSVEYAFDNSKILFFFTANGRVDFRSLVKDLASVFKMRIELRQIGVRDEAKMLGGLGPCGRPICCGSFLDQFQPVSIKMAKEQNLSLNPTKISGVCGRLMCCLKFEQDHYETTRKKMPKIGREVITPDGTGTVTELNIVKETVTVRIVDGDSSEIKEYPLEKISRASSDRPAQAEPVEQPPVDDEEEFNAFEPAAKSAEPARPPRPQPAVPRNNPERTEKPAKPAEPKNPSPNNAPRQKNRNDGKRPPLGQPVKRENPNRQPNAASQSAAPAQPAPAPQKKPAAPQKPAPVPPKKAEPAAPVKASNGWADALQKALDAIDQEKQ